MTFPTLPDILPGDILDAATIEEEQDGIRSLAGVFKRKTVDETVNNTAVLQNDDVLFVSVEANAIYSTTLMIHYTSGATPDLKVALTYPTGLTARWRQLGYFAAALQSVQSTEAGTSALDGGTAWTVEYKGLVVVGANAGTLQLQWAQNTMNASNTSVLAGSYIELRRLS